jgi:hypothetical protein
VYAGDIQVTDGSGPDFVCIGAQKSGTTWLYENLARHSEVWVPPVKEFHYFDRLCVNDRLLGLWSFPHPHGIARYKSALRSLDAKRLRWLRQFYRLGMDKGWYLDLFDAKYSGGKVSVDITPGYSTLEEKGVKFARSVLGGDVYIILIVRNPVHRSWSAAKMLLRYRRVDPDKMSQKQWTELLTSPMITLYSEYSRMIPLWKKYFRNFHVLSYDQLCNSPREFLSQVSDITGISDRWNDNVMKRRVWADDKNISMPPEVLTALTAQYSEEVKALISMEGLACAKSWYEEMTRL